MITDLRGKRGSPEAGRVGLESKGVARPIKIQLRSTATSVIQTASTPSRPLSAGFGRQLLDSGAGGVNESSIAVDLCN